MKTKRIIGSLLLPFLATSCRTPSISSNSQKTDDSSKEKSETGKTDSFKTTTTDKEEPLKENIERLKDGYTIFMDITYTYSDGTKVQTSGGYLSSGRDSYSYYEPEHETLDGYQEKKREFYHRGEDDSLMLDYLDFSNNVQSIKYQGNIDFVTGKYENPFLDVTESSFRKEADGYHLEEDDISHSLFANQLKTDEENLDEVFFSSDFTTYRIRIQNGGEEKDIEGKLLLGEENLIQVEPIQGEEDPVFQEAMEKIGNGNYVMKSTYSKYKADIGDYVPQSTALIEADVSSSIDIQTYDGTYNLISEIGFVDDGKGKIQACININDSFYPDGKTMTARLQDALPNPDISSLFFDRTTIRKTATGSKVSLYRIRKDLPSYVELEKFSYLDPMADSDCDIEDMTIAVSDKENDEFVQIINETSSKRYRVLYSDFSEVEEPISYQAIEENGDNLTFEDYYTYKDETEMELLEADLGSLDVLNRIPTFGSYYNNIEILYSQESDSSRMEIRTNPTNPGNITFQDIKALENDYETKLVTESGFEKTAAPTKPVDKKNDFFQLRNVSYIDPTGKEKTVTLQLEVGVLNEDSKAGLILYPSVF